PSTAEDSARSAPRWSKASTSIAWRMSLPYPLPCASRVSQEPELTVRRSAKRSAETSWQPIRCPPAQTPSGSVQSSGPMPLRRRHWKRSASRTRVSGSARYQGKTCGESSSSKIGRRISAAYSGRSASASGRRVRSPARTTRPSGGNRAAGSGGGVIGPGQGCPGASAIDFPRRAVLRWGHDRRRAADRLRPLRRGGDQRVLGGGAPCRAAAAREGLAVASLELPVEFGRAGELLAAAVREHRPSL